MEQTNTAPTGGSSPTETGSKATSETSQEAGKPQSPAGAQVESPESTATSQTTERPTKPKVSDFYRQRESQRQEFNRLREENKKLFDELAAIKEQISSASKPQKTPTEEELKKEFWDSGPETFVVKTRKELLEEMNRLKQELVEKEFPKFFERFRNGSEFQRKTQEAMEILFPKSNPESKETWEQRAEKDLNRVQRINQIIEDYGLKMVSEKEPLKAANAILKILESENPKENPRNPLALKKSQMFSTATSSPMGGGKAMPTPQEMSSEFERMRVQIEENPALMKDDKFMERWQILKEGMLESSTK